MGAELWRTDGTRRGTVRFTNLLVPRGDPTLGLLQGSVLFAGIDSSTGDPPRSELWVSDGTPAGTRQLTDQTNPASSLPSNLVAAGDRLFFAVHRGRAPYDFANLAYTTDGSARVVPAPDGLLSDLAGIIPPAMVPLSSAGGVVFVNQGGATSQLWRSDGTAAGTAALTRFAPPQSVVPSLVASGGRAHFVVTGASSSVWTSDGTPQGTAKLFDLPAAMPDPRDLRVFASGIYLVTGGPNGAVQVWRSNGTTGGTVQVTGFADPAVALGEHLPMAELGGIVYFAVTGFSNGTLWRTDGTAAGTFEVTQAGTFFVNPSDLVAAGGALYFFAEWGPPKHLSRTLWRLDGSAAAAGPQALHDYLPAVLGTADPGGLTPFAGGVAFAADDGTSGAEPWFSDGTPGGTRARFKVEAFWRDFQGNSGAGMAAPLTADTGTFWFFGPDNIELIVKVLDGRPLDGHFWVFYGALSSVEYSLTVTDTQTGLVRRYFNPLGQLASVGDTHAFGPQGATSTGGQAAARAPIQMPVAAPGAEAPSGPQATGSCQPRPRRLCLGGGRFAVEATWTDFTGRSGAGMAVPLSDGTGYFWFFGADNVETVLKVLDGRPVNGHFWVFFGALSNVQYTLTVTDTVSGASKTYNNPLGQFASVADTAAF